MVTARNGPDVPHVVHWDLGAKRRSWPHPSLGVMGDAQHWRLGLDDTLIGRFRPDVDGLQQRFTVDDTGCLTGFVMIPGGTS